MSTEYEPGLQDYLSMIRRRAPYLIGIFAAVFIISIIVAIVTPATYLASGTIMVDSQQVSDSVIPDAVKNQLDEQIKVIKLRLLTRENLLQLGAKYKLFKSSGGQPSLDDIDNLRSHIIITTDNSGTPVRTNRQGQQVLTFSLAFEDRRADISYAVTKDLLDQFLDLNVKLRTEGAIETTDFLTQESDKLKAELDHQEQLIADYKQQNKQALPEQLTLRMTMLSRAENDLREVERDQRSISEDIRALEVELAAAKKNNLSDDTSKDSLPAMKAELARLSAIYKDTHPDIRSLKRKIAILEASADSGGIETSPTVVKVQAKLDSDKARLASLIEQKEMLQKKINENESAMILTPKVEQGLDVLIRDRDIAKKKFEEFRSKRMNAKIAENLESENKSGRLAVLEPPVMPTKPYKPNRIKIILAGFFLALIAAVGISYLIESSDKRIYGSGALTHALGQRPMVVIPYIINAEDLIFARRRIKFFIAAGSTIFLIVLLALLYIYTPALL